MTLDTLRRSSILHMVMVTFKIDLKRNRAWVQGLSSQGLLVAKTLGRPRLPLTTRPQIKSKLSLKIRKTE